MIIYSDYYLRMLPPFLAVQTGQTATVLVLQYLLIDVFYRETSLNFHRYHFKNVIKLFELFYFLMQ
ncbi:hypothetical protein SAMN04488057_12213 [Cyclobacterium lianum]|uniref:Uncharacterized protein n=1 Tax=Cyclobacterium lianum TaxID=388280 RepID=A0A1M7QQR4_9BACT|nr:hypothetical protein SAMN04488057_12213 [Cyclobacterium lianum]